jgi:hypothetical protein
MPRIAERMDRMALIRSLTGAVDNMKAPCAADGLSTWIVCEYWRPTQIGSYVAKLQGRTATFPPPVAMKSLMHPSQIFRSAGFLASLLTVSDPDGKLERANLKARNINPDRRHLLSQFDTMRRNSMHAAPWKRWMPIPSGLFDRVASAEFADALDIDREPLAVRNRYGVGPGVSLSGHKLGLDNANFLMARRLDRMWSAAVST